jgi:pilus assembly protein FimV
MNRNSRISARALLAAATLAASPTAWSLGLGDVTVESYLDQPLRARIDLVTQPSDDLASVSAKLASAADYELIGASLEDISVPVRFTVENIDGDAYLLASSQLAVNNPVIRLIVEVNWSSGRMLREYTLFLDPPTTTDQAAPLPRIDQRESAPAEPAPTPPPPVAPVTRQPEPEAVREPDAAPAQTEREAGQVSEPGVYGPVASGETLWAIANDWSAGTGIPINKVMIAIQRENPEAFLNNNINLLKRGAILRMPQAQDIDRIPVAAANNEVASQEEEFYESKGMTSPYSSSTPLLSDDRAEDDFAYPDPRQPSIEPEPEAVIEPEPEPEPEPVATEPEADVESPAAQPDEVDSEPVVEAGLDEAAEAAQDMDAPAEPEQEESASETLSEVAEEATEEPSLVDQLELVPPSEASELDSTYGFEETDEEGNAVATQALRENLARAEEELITQQQQNEYLQERIRELEEQLEEAEDSSVADADLAAMEQRLREERAAGQGAGVEQPWYSRFGVWLLGLLVLAAAVIGWLFSRRTGDVDEETIQEIKDEAEEVLRVLDKDSGTSVKPAGDETAEAEEPEAQDSGAEEDAEEDDEEARDEAEDKGGAKPAPAAFGGGEEEASLLDEESSDPEIQLDLARAYISMGDKEAARVILEEVAANGSEEQQAEAQKMLDLM